MGRMNFNTRTLNVFSEMGTTYDQLKNLMFDLYNGELGEGVKKADAERKLREISQKIFGITDKSS